MKSQNIIEDARKIQKKYGTSYYIATLFFPKKIKEDVFILYAFVRTSDEFVDNPLPGSDPASELFLWRASWEKAYESGESDNPLLVATAELFKKYNIPFELSIEFIDAMARDLVTADYDTYADLRGYTRGSAEVIGIMLTHIMGYTDRAAFTYAAKLGEAMQLTNFLRDIEEDYRDRGRIYLPKEDMRAYNVTEAMIKGKAVTPEFIHLMKFEIGRARKLFREADLGICMLSKNTQFPVRLASHLYEKILDKIEGVHYDIFSNRVRSSALEKAWIISKTYVNH